jgi:hypothetical protein
MQLMVSRSYPAINAQTLAEFVARDALFRTADGSFVLYMASGPLAGAEERVLFLNCRDALLWLNETPEERVSYWELADSVKQSCQSQNRAALQDNFR